MLKLQLAFVTKMMKTVRAKSKIFFSYAWRDMGLAMRIDNDLRNSGIKNIWRDRVDSKPAENFREEYLKEIDNCSHFILLDSENYRIHANWCKDEITRFLAAKQKDETKKLIVCLSQNAGNWRKKEKLFDDQEFYKYIDFSIADEGGCIYDNAGKYGKAIDELCAIFGVKYQPWIEKDYEQDLLDELKEDSKISEKDRTCIIHDYENIRHYWLLNHYTIESRIRNFIADYEALKLTSYMPYMLLVDFLSQKDKWQDCYDVLQTVTTKFPDEPRSYRWLGTLSLHLKKYDEALQYYNRSIELSNIPKHKKQKEYYNKVLLNISDIYIQQKKFQTALLKLSELNQKQDELSEEEYIVLVKYQSFCNIVLNDVEKNYDILQNGLKKYPQCSEFYELLGHYYLRQNNFTKAITMYEIAIENCDKNKLSITNGINYYTSLANAYNLLNNKKEVENILSIVESKYIDVFEKSELTNEDKQNIKLIYSFLET